MRFGDLPWRRIAAGLAAGLAAFSVVVWLGTAPADVEGLESGPVQAPWAAWEEMAREARADGEAFEPRWEWVPLDSIALSMQAAAVAGEDIGFLFHEGIDWAAVREAVEEWVEGDRLRGASTITQQTAKNLFLTSRRSIFRKVAEVRQARALEEGLGKRRILEIYLNIVELGRGVLGVEAASRYYYGIPASRLDRLEAAGLAAALPSPRKDNPATSTRTWSFRREVILTRMAEYDWLPERLLALHPPGTARFLAARYRADLIAAGTDSSGADTAEADTFGADTVWTDTIGAGIARADTDAPDTARADTAAADTARADTDAPDTAWVDTAAADTASTDTLRTIPPDTNPPDTIPPERAPSSTGMGTLLFQALVGAVPAADTLRLDGLRGTPVGTALPSGWEVRPVSGFEAPSSRVDSTALGPALRLEAEGQAAFFWRELEEQVPVGEGTLEWTWRVDEAPEGADLQVEDRDDCPIRLIVVFGQRGFLRRPRIIFYSWSGSMEEGAWYHSRVSRRMGVLSAASTAADPLGTWLTERRDPAEDYRAIWGEEPPAIGAVGLMADTDQPGQRSVAWLASIRWVPGPGG